MFHHRVVSLTTPRTSAAQQAQLQQRGSTSPPLRWSVAAVALSGAIQAATAEAHRRAARAAPPAPPARHRVRAAPGGPSRARAPRAPQHPSSSPAAQPCVPHCPGPPAPAARPHGRMPRPLRLPARRRPHHRQRVPRRKVPVEALAVHVHQQRVVVPDEPPHVTRHAREHQQRRVRLRQLREAQPQQLRNLRKVGCQTSNTRE